MDVELVDVVIGGYARRGPGDRFSVDLGARAGAAGCNTQRNQLHLISLETEPRWTPVRRASSPIYTSLLSFLSQPRNASTPKVKVYLRLDENILIPSGAAVEAINSFRNVRRSAWMRKRCVGKLFSVVSS